MYGLFKDVKPLVAPKPFREYPRPDNGVFKLHYRLTVAILLVGSILVSAYNYIDRKGSAIQCLIDKNSPVPQDVINNFCWIQSTFTLPQHYHGEKNEEFVHWGVGPHKDGDERVYHAYYQWVPLVLAFQALFFYAPHWIWKQLEGGRFKHIVAGLNIYIRDATARDDQVGALADYMRERIRHSTEHQMWAIKFFACECLNFVNVVAQIFITNWFLGGEFTSYGTEVLRFSSLEPQERVDPMSRVFPKMTKCTFHKFGGSGTIQVVDSMCVLAMNILSEKIYIFLWFWFIILAVITGIQVVFRIVQMCSPGVRNRFAKLEKMGLSGRAVRREDVEFVVHRLTYADWLILFYLSAALNKENFGALITNLAADMPEQKLAVEDDRWFGPPPTEVAAATATATAPGPHNSDTMRKVGGGGGGSGEEERLMGGGDGGGGGAVGEDGPPDGPWVNPARKESLPMKVIRSLSNK